MGTGRSPAVAPALVVVVDVVAELELAPPVLPVRLRDPTGVAENDLV